MKRAASAVLAAVLAAGCGRQAPPAAAGEKAAESDRAVVSLERVTARRGPSESAPSAGALTRGTEVQITGKEDGFLVVTAGGESGLFVPADSVERIADRDARKQRATQVAGFAAQPGRAVEDCPILLAPDFGSARWGVVADGSDVEVLLADHDFYGIRAADGLAFAPARSIRLLPGELALPEQKERKGVTNLSIQSLNPEAAVPVQPLPAAPDVAPPEIPPAPPPALEGLPPGATEPELVVRVEPRYPEIARRMGWEGEVVLKAVVETDGRVDRVSVVSGAKPGMAEAAAEALRRWVYRPARVDGRPVAVYKTFRIAFSLKGE